MIVFSRKKNESLVINDDITIVVIEIRGDKVRLGVEAPKEVPIHRREVFDAIRRNEVYGSVPARTSDIPASTSGIPAAAVSEPAQITLSSRLVGFVDRLRNAIREKSGTAPCRAQTIEAILEAVQQSESRLSGAKSLSDLKAKVAQTAQSDGAGRSNSLSRLFGRR